MSDEEVGEALASLIAGQPTKRSRKNSKSGSMKKRMRKVEAARLAKRKPGAAKVMAEVAKGAAPTTTNAGQSTETEAEKSARETFENGADRQVPWTHHFDFLRSPRVTIARDGGLRRVRCNAFSKAPWPPLCERPLHLSSTL